MTDLTPTHAENIESAPFLAKAQKREAIAALAVATLIVTVSCARLPGLLYQHYLGGILFQTSTLVLLIIWAYPKVRERRSSVHLGTVLLFGYATVSGLSFLWAPQQQLAFIGSLPILFSITWAICVGSLLRHRGNIGLVMQAIFLAGVLAACAAIYYVISEYSSEKGFDLGCVEAVQGHRNFLAMFLLPPILLGASELLKKVIGRDTAAYGALEMSPTIVLPCLVVMIVALWLCKSWGATIGLAAGLLCLFAVLMTKRQRVVLLCAALSIVGLVGVIVSMSPVTERLLRNQQATRWFMWQGATRMALDRPLAGWGSGMFVLYFSDYKPTLPMQYGWLISKTLYPHNEPLLVAIEGGALGLCLYITALFFAVRAVLKAAKDGQDVSAQLIGWTLGACFVAMFTHGLFEISLRMWAPSAMMWTIVGLMLAWPGSAQPGFSFAWKPWPTFVRGIRFILILGIVGVVAWYVTWRGAKAEWLLGTIRYDGKNAEKYFERNATAIRFSRYIPDYLIALERRARNMPEAERLDDKISAYEELEQVAPGYGDAGMLRATLSRLYRNRCVRWKEKKLWGTRALMMSERAISQNPYNPVAQCEYGAALFFSGKKKDALDALMCAEELCERESIRLTGREDANRRLAELASIRKQILKLRTIIKSAKVGA